MKTNDEILVYYQTKNIQENANLGKFKKLIQIHTLLRFLSFISAFIAFYILFSINVIIASLAFISFFSLFIYFVKKFNAINKLFALSTQKQKLFEAEINAINGDFSGFEDGTELEPENHDFSLDMDLFGRKSLFQFLNRTCSSSGKKSLGNSLLKQKHNDDINKYQNIIKELSEKKDWRHQFYAVGKLSTESHEEIQRIKSWSTKEINISNSFVFKILSWLLPILIIIALILTIANVMSYMVLVFMILINMTFLGKYIGKINNYFSSIGKNVSLINKYSNLLQIIEKEDFINNDLQIIKDKLFQSSFPASALINRLSRLFTAFEFRLNMVVGALLNIFLLWDIHIINKIENWRKKYNADLQQFFEVVDFFDTYNSLANFAFNNPTYCYPEIISKGIFLEAQDIGHPLIPGKNRICNDISIDKAHQFQIITGGNMAGKSTFLRTIGVNLILGMMGAPVCARKMIFKPIQIFSSMRTNDSLSDNESYFFAEIKKLKEIIENLKTGAECFIILDEILKGTNSTDQQIGSKALLLQLIRYECYGIIATHDLSLGELEKSHPENFSNKCFEVGIDKDKLEFKYKLSTGIAQNLNASFLMKQMGIIVENNTD